MSSTTDTDPGARTLTVPKWACFIIGAAAGLVGFVPDLVAWLRRLNQGSDSAGMGGYTQLDLVLQANPLISWMSLMVLAGGFIAGIVTRLVHKARSLPLAAVATGLLVVQLLAVIWGLVRSAGTVGYGTGLPPVVFDVLCVVLAQVLLWMMTRPGSRIPALAVGVMALPIVWWLLSMIPLWTSAMGWTRWVGFTLPGLVAGIGLGWGGVKPLNRLWSWLVVLALLFLLPLSQFGLAGLFSPYGTFYVLTYGSALVVAVVIGLALTGARALWGRGREARV